MGTYPRHCRAQGLATLLAGAIVRCAPAAGSALDGATSAIDSGAVLLDAQVAPADGGRAQDAGLAGDVGPSTDTAFAGDGGDAAVDEEPPRVADEIFHVGSANGGGTVGLSRAGRFLMFDSPLPLDPSDTNGLWDVHVLDRVGGTVVRASLDGSRGFDDFGLQVSDDGRFVLFGTDRNLVPEDRRGVDLYLRDLATGEVELISGSHEDLHWEGAAGAMSADGNVVVWTATRDPRVPQDANGSGVDVFVLDRARDTVSIANVDALGRQTDGDSLHATVSADGRYVAFHSSSSALLGRPTGLGERYPYVYDRVTSTIEMVATSSTGAPSNGPCGERLSLSGDGQRVAFICNGTNLVGGYTEVPLHMIFVKDRISGAVTPVLPLDGRTQIVQSAALSRDGRFVAFESAHCTLAGDVTCDCLAGTYYVRDLATTTIYRLGYDNRCVPPRNFLGLVQPPQWSADGRFIGFESALRLTPTADDEDVDLFVYSFCRR